MYRALVFLGASLVSVSPAHSEDFVTAQLTNSAGSTLSMAEAELKATRSICGEIRTEVPSVSTNIGSNGRIVLPSRGLGLWSLKVRIPGQPPIERLVKPFLDALDLGSLEVPEARPMSVVVRDIDGRSISGIKVRAEGQTSDGWRSAARTTDEKGVAVVGVLAGESWSVVIEGYDVGSQEQLGSDRIVVEARPKLRLKGVSEEILHIEGLLMDSATGRPLADGLIWVSGRPDCYIKSDSRGRFEMSLPKEVGEEPLQLLGMKEGYARGKFKAREWARGPVELRLQQRSGILQGVVEDPRGQPIPWAAIEGWGGRSTTSDSQGRFRLSALPEGRPGNLVIRADGFTPARRTITPSSHRNSTLTEVTLWPRRDVVGTVIGPDGHPVAEVTVRVHQELSQLQTTTTDDKGRFVLRSLAATPMRLILKRRGHAVTERRIDVTRGWGSFDVGSLQLPWELTLEGRVSDMTGAPIEGARIFVDREFQSFERKPDGEPSGEPSAVTDADGWFALRTLSAGLLELEFWKAGFGPERLEVLVSEDRELELQMKPARRLIVHVVDRGGAPLEGVDVELKADSSEVVFSGSREFAKTDSNGRVVIGSLSSPRVRLRAWKDGYGVGEASIEFTEGQEEAVATVTLFEECTLVGVVRDPQGNPVPNAQVGVKSASGREVLTGDVTDYAGRFNLPMLSPGLSRLRVSHEDFETESLTVDVLPDTENRVEVVLKSRGLAEVTGMVLEEGRWPRPGVGVELIEVGGGVPYEVHTNTNGVFRIETIPYGTYGVRILDHDFVAASTSRQVEITMPISKVRVSVVRPCSLEGLVTGATQVELRQLTIRASNSDTRSVRIPVDPWEGTFEHMLPPGEWRLVATLESTERTQQVDLFCESGARVLTELEF